MSTMSKKTMRPLDARMPIGVFDSGVGGLTVLKALRELLPAEEYCYLGDTARLPYGTKSRESVIRYALQSSRRLVEQGVKLLVVACNTASASALPALENAYPDIPVVGVIAPGARAGCAVNSNGRMAVIATESTVQGGAYQDAIRALCPDMRIEAQATSLFVALAEEGWTHGELVERIIEKSLAPLFAKFPHNEPPGSLVLGCTHFPVLARAIENVVGPDVTVIDSAVTTAQEVKTLLQERSMLNRETQGAGQTRFFATDGAERFSRVGGVFLGQKLDEKDVVLVDL